MNLVLNLDFLCKPSTFVPKLLLDLLRNTELNVSVAERDLCCCVKQEMKFQELILVFIFANCYSNIFFPQLLVMYTLNPKQQRAGLVLVCSLRADQEKRPQIITPCIGLYSK